VVNVLSLFTGIGGLDLGLERAGMTVVGQVEIDPWCRKVLAKHWPEVPRHDDVRTAADWWLAPMADAEGDRRRTWRPGRPAGDGANRQGHASAGLAEATPGRPAVDVVAGGFPCQPVSLAGKGLAQADSRWLWPAFADVIRHLRPRYVLVENVPGLLGRGMGDVLGDLAALGYDAEWDCVPAAFVGAPHIRNRVWIVAYPSRPGLAQRESQPRNDGAERAPAQRGGHGPRDVADSERDGLERPRQSAVARQRAPILRRRPPEPGWWATEPGVGRVAHGIPNRVDRLRGLGNAVVPQVAQHIGELIMAADMPP
jgi:DNA (cytosine-5)-methyltransferase 1